MAPQSQPESYTSSLSSALVEVAAQLPLICPHGHVDPALFSRDDYRFGSPIDLLIIPDHYVFRMLYSQGIALERLGIPRRDGGRVERDHRVIWQTVADNWFLFRGTPTAAWIRDELREVFGISDRLNAENAQAIYTAIESRLAQPDFTPRRLFERFNIEVLATTDAATDTLDHHQAIRDSGWSGRVIPTFRPDAVVNLNTPGWSDHIARLSEVSGITVTSYKRFVQALEQRRDYFRSMGALATDHGTASACTEVLSPGEAESIFRRALAGTADASDVQRFTGHMLVEMARMSSEDGLVMQLHIGSYRNHNPALFAAFGPDKGADIPLQAEFTHNLRSLLDAFGTHPRVSIILFTLDESTYSRELAPLAGHYPALKLGPPWWFFDSYNGMRRYFDTVMETAGLYNTAGFNDDTRAFPSIPARHRLWQRASADWLASLVQRGDLEVDEAFAMIVDLAVNLARKAYKL